MKRLLMAVIYLASLVTTSAAQVGVVSTRPLKSSQVAGAASKRSATKSGKTAEALPAPRFSGNLDIKQDNTYIQNQTGQVEQHIKAKLSQTSQAVVDDCHEVSRALRLDPFYKALGVSKEKQNKSASKGNNALTKAEAIATLKELSRRIYDAAQQEKSPYAKEALQTQAHLLFPVFASLGALDPVAKKWEANNLRTFIRNHPKACASGDANQCHAVLTAIRTLPILDERTEQNKDALLVSDFLEANYESAQAASVLQTCAVGLIALGRTNMLVAFVEQAEGKNLGFWSRLGNVVQLEYWSEKGAEMVRGFGDRWVSRANRSSYYKIKGKTSERLGNVYQDLGEWLASEKENGKYVYRNQVDLSMFLHAYENGALHVSAPAFVTGALLGGMTLPDTATLKRMQTGYVMNGKGQVSYTDTTAAWNAVQKRLDALHTNITGLALQELYAHPKAEMSYAQRTDLNNRIYERYSKVTPKVNGKIYRPVWMKHQEVSGVQQALDTSFSAVSQVASVVDIGIAVLGIATGAASGFGVAKLASFGVRTMSKARYMIALARAQKGHLTIAELRSLAELRQAARGAATVTAKTSAGTETAAAAVGATAQKAQGAGASVAKVTPLRRSGQPSASKPAQTAGANQTTPGAQNPGASGQAPLPQVPAAEPKPGAVSPTQLEQQVEGPLAQQVQLKKTYQAPTMETKGLGTYRDVAASDVAGSATQASEGQITIDNFLEAKRVNGKYQVKGVDKDGNVFSQELTTAQYRDLQREARATGKRESLEMRGQRNQLAQRRAAAQTAGETPAPATSAPLEQATQQAAQQIAEQIDQVKRLSATSDRLLLDASLSRTTVIEAQENVAKAETLYASLTQQGQEIDSLYVEINDLQRAVRTGKVKNTAELSNQTAQVAQKVKRIKELVQQMQSASAQLRSLEVNAVVKLLGKARVTAQKKLAEVRNILQQANAANIPASETEQLRKALQQAENSLYSTQGAGREALALGKKGDFSQAVDKATAAQRKVESALQKVEDYVEIFQQTWGHQLKQAAKLPYTRATKNSSATLNRVSAVGNSNVPGVYPLLDSNGNIIAYGKISTQQELERTRQFARIMQGSSRNLHKAHPNLEIEYPEILSEDFSQLPASVQQNIAQSLQNMTWDKNGRGTLVQSGQFSTFTMSAVDTRGFSLSWRTLEPTGAPPSWVSDEVLKIFNGKPITRAEWVDLENLIVDINKAGFQHGDLQPNLFLRRNPKTGKLKVTFIDFEVFSDAYSDQQTIAQMKKELIQYRALEP